MPYRAYEPCSMSHAAWIFNQNLFSDVQSDERDRQEYSNAGIRTISQIVAQQRAEQNNATQQQATHQQHATQQQNDDENHVIISDENDDDNADENQPGPNESPALFDNVDGSANDGNGSRDEDMTPNDLPQPEEPQNIEPQMIQGPDLWWYKSHILYFCPRIFSNS